VIRDRLPTRRPSGTRTARAIGAGLTCLLAGPLWAACGVDGPAPVLVVEEVASPAGEGSGEPFLSSAGDTVFMSWLEAIGGGRQELRLGTFVEGGWTAPVVIAASDGFFVNWADFPSVTRGPDGTLWAHWLERGGAPTTGGGGSGGYDYGVRIVRSADGGATWSAPWTPHEDGTPTEHGFVSTVAVGDGLGFLWLDGRRFVTGEAGAPPSEEMALYFRTADASGGAGPETVVDARVCDCCQTDMALTAAGPVAVYRDRSEGEIRDIHVRRYSGGAWTDGEIVHEDGWETAACPVNGPAVAARGEDVAVAWFTAAGGVPRVKVAFSRDAAESFGEPLLVDGGNPAGRVDLVLLEDGAALVSWLERSGGEWADVRVRRVEPGGRIGESVSVSPSSGERASGFPRIAASGDGSVMAAWTDVTELTPRVRVARIELETAAGDGR
jgi:hypothetical protein